jgi:SpoVK/Ycf46/Vps4 family AAA+-type ATPase
LGENGRYRLRKCINGTWYGLKHWTTNEHIRLGQPALNELLIVQLTDRARFYINEKFVDELMFLERPSGNGFGFVVSGQQHIRIHSTIVLRHIEWPPEANSTRPLNAADVQTVLAELNGLIGLDNIKQEVRTFINFLRVQKMRQERGLLTTSLNYHMVLAGPPGTGKTTVARLIGKIYKELGLLPQGHVVETDRAGLVAPYVGQTALKVDSLVEKALGGILFIDEAYALMPRSGRDGHDFGREAIEALLKRMEDHRGNFAVIIAGYANEMHRFLEANSGVKSRFNRYFYFSHYKPDELLAIFEKMGQEAGLVLTERAQAKLRTSFDRVCRGRNDAFGNGRFARNLLEKTIEQQANRIVDLIPMTDDILATITSADIPDLDAFPVS